MTEHSQMDTRRRGVIVFLFLAIATIVEFGVAVYTSMWGLLALLAVIKAGLVMYYYMHIHLLFEPDAATDHKSYAFKLVTNRLGLWLFMLSDFFIFAGLLLTRLFLLGLTRPDLNQTLGLIVTSVLLVSSFFANRAEASMVLGDIKGFTRSIAITITLGILFIAGVLGIEWQLAPFSASDGVQGPIFYTMTGFHAFHVLTGVIFLLIVLRNGRRGHYTAEKHWAVEAATVYWHFIDVVWIFFYPALYLIGTAL
jgi:cytochrome c oxidase subunit III